MELLLTFVHTDVILIVAKEHAHDRQERHINAVPQLMENSMQADELQTRDALSDPDASLAETLAVLGQ
jgi:hypothetical protein